jgi:carboxyl-terminal processing protease
VPDFESDIPALVREALQTMDPHSPDLIVVDLRDNGGGFVASALAVASEFITDGPIVTLATPSESVTEEAFGDAIAASPRLVVLVNRGTASAAEILAAALRDRREAVLVGETTFGKDAVQIPFDLRNGGRLDLVVARWASPSGATVAGAGLSPDVEAALGATLTIEELVDTVLALLS